MNTILLRAVLIKYFRAAAINIYQLTKCNMEEAALLTRYLEVQSDCSTDRHGPQLHCNLICSCRKQLFAAKETGRHFKQISANHTQITQKMFSASAEPR